jgi:hypothetical protein
MKNTCYAVLFIVLFILTVNAERSRFSRILTIYEYPGYTIEKKDASLFLNYTQPITTIFIVPGLYDTVSTVRQLFQGLITYESNNSVSNEKSLSKKRFTLILDNKFDTYGLNSDYMEYFDTSDYRGVLSTEYTRKYQYYKNRKSAPFGAPFIAGEGTLYSELFWQSRKDFIPLLDPELPDSEKTERHILRQQNLTVVADLCLSVGLGRQQNISPVYQALQVEKRLLNNGVSDFILSDSSLCRMAQFLANQNSYTLRKPQKAQIFKKGLDSTLMKDVAIEKRNLRHISSMEIRKIITRTIPLFFIKPTVRLFSFSRLITDFMRYDLSYPYDHNNQYPDTVFIKPALSYRHLIGLDADWGYPLGHRLFFSAHATRFLLSTEETLHFIDHEKKTINADEVLDMRWNLGLSLWLSDWLMLQTSAQNWPSWLCIPRSWPMLVEVRVSAFLEDYLSFSLGAVYYNKSFENDPYRFWNDPLKKKTRQTSFTFFFKVLYSF